MTSQKYSGTFFSDFEKNALSSKKNSKRPVKVRKKTIISTKKKVPPRSSDLQIAVVSK